MSGAVGAMCRQRSVDSARVMRVIGGVGTYLNMSSTGWPECTSRVRDACGSSDARDTPFVFDFEVDAPGWLARTPDGVGSRPGATLMKVGFDSQAKVA